MGLLKPIWTRLGGSLEMACALGFDLYVDGSRGEWHWRVNSRLRPKASDAVRVGIQSTKQKARAAAIEEATRLNEESERRREQALDQPITLRALKAALEKGRIAAWDNVRNADNTQVITAHDASNMLDAFVFSVTNDLDPEEA